MNTRAPRPIDAPHAATLTGVVSEIFCSVQGEGIYAGERQVFVRTAGCSATCYWCDTVSSKKVRPLCLIHGTTRRSLPNPVSCEDVIAEVVALAEEEGPVRTVSLTGGEPLEQAGFVLSLAVGLRKCGLRVYLETNGLEPDAMRLLAPHVDVTAMDIKLPSATGCAHWQAHRDFLRVASGSGLFLKIVVDEKTPLEEIEYAFDLVAVEAPETPVILQPESRTFLRNGRGSPSRDRLMRLVETAQREGSRRVQDVRIMPQLHKMMKLR